MAIRDTALCILFLLSILDIAHANLGFGFRETSQFRQWYPAYSHIFARIRDDNCSTDYENYIRKTTNISLDEVIASGGDKDTQLVQQVILCILDNTNEYVKSKMANAQVLLGLMPTVLSIIGPSSEEFAILSVLGRRPIFTLILILAAPSFFLARAFEPVFPEKVLKPQPGRFFSEFGGQWVRGGLVFGQYAIALGALVNTMLSCFDLSMRSPNGVLPNFPYTPFVWVALAFGVHFLGLILVRLRAKRFHNPPSSFLKGELALEAKAPPCIITQDGGGGHYKLWFLSIGWLHSCCIVLHLTFGTTLFSSMLFIAASDAFWLMMRFFLSVIACRLLLMYELDRMRKGYERWRSPENGDSESLPLV